MGIIVLEINGEKIKNKKNLFAHEKRKIRAMKIKCTMLFSHVVALNAYLIQRQSNENSTKCNN